MRKSVALALTLFLGDYAFATAEAPRFQWPVDCTRGEDCVVQQYPDLDPGPAARDPACGARAYDGHQGVDIRLISFADLRRDVKALAAADGVVLRLRDGAPERRFANGAVHLPKTDVPDCGNGLVIDHGGGFETQYCHLKTGSVLARRGQMVRAGDPVGIIGLSGRTEFPHLHITFRKDGAVIDPFTSARIGSACDQKKAASGAASLWAESALRYEPAALLDAGVIGRRPSYSEAKAGALSDVRPSRASPALVGWSRILGPAKGDRITLRLFGPDGGRIASSERIMKKSRAIEFLFAGRRARGAWPSGDYRLEIALYRKGRRLLREERALRLR